MREEIKLLVGLQGLDSTIQDLNRIKTKLARDMAEIDRAALEEKKQLEASVSDAKTFKRELDKRELDLKEAEGRIEKLEIQLNTVKTNKEYAAFQHEILGMKADKSRIEDDILKMFDQAESQQKRLKELNEQAKASATGGDVRKKAMQTALRDADARIARVQQERTELAAKIPEAFRDPYDRLRKRTDGLAMAACRNFVCGGCRMSLTANTVSLLMGGDRLVYCHSCGRILYIAENEDMTGISAAGRKESW